MSLSDVRNAALRAQGFTGNDNEMMIAWAQDNGATSPQYNSAIMQVLRANGATTTDFNGAWEEFLIDQGFSGDFNSMEHEFWTAGGSLYAFYAPLTDSLTEGRNNITSFTRSGGDEPTVTDFEGLVKDVLDDEARFVGARRVENVLAAPMDKWAASLSTLTNNGDGSYTLEATATGSVAIAVTLVGNVKIGDSVRNTIEIRRHSTNIGTQDESIYQGDIVGVVKDISAALVDDEWVRVAGDVEVITLTTIAKHGFTVSGTIGDKWDFRNIQTEVVTGQANQEPSEYVSVGIGTKSNIAQDPSFENEVQAAVWDWTEQGTAVSFTKIIGGFRAAITGSGVYSSAYISSSFSKNNDVVKQGRLYEVGVKIENYYENVKGGSASINAFLGYDDVTGIGPTNVTGDGWITGVARCDNSDAGEDDIWLYPNISGLAGDDWGFDITETYVKEIDHGSNVDGVKYFDTLNYNTTDANGYVSRLALPADLGIGIVQDPTMDNDSSGADGDGVDWTWSLNTFIKTGGKLVGQGGGFSVLVTSGAPTETGHYYRVQYDIDVVSTLSNVQCGSVSLPITQGSHDYIVKALSSDFRFFAFAGVGNLTQFDNIQVTPINNIPDDYLKGVLIEETSTNLFLNSEDPDTATYVHWQAVNGNTTQVDDRIWKWIPNSTAGVNHYFNQNSAVTATLWYTLSMLVKADGYDFFQVAPSNGFTSDHVNFDLINGTVTVQGAAGATGYIEPHALGDGWFKIWVSMAAISSPSTGRFVYGTIPNGTIGRIGTWTADGTGGTLVQQLQWEELPYPTSYIPTAGSTATRSDESLFYEVPSALLVTESSITALCEYDLRGNLDPFASVHLAIDMGRTDNSNRFRVQYSAGVGYRGIIKEAGVTNTISTLTVPSEEVVKQGLRCGEKPAPDKDAIYVNGSKETNLTVNYTPNFTGAMYDLAIGCDISGFKQLNAPMKAVRIYDKTFSDAEMLEATS